MGRVIEDEAVRAARLLDAQAKAAELFAAVGAHGIIAPGVREITASDAIRDLAAAMFGVDRYWHKRIVRAGPNTLQPYRENPPDRVIAADDIVSGPGRQIGGCHEELLDLGHDREAPCAGCSG